MVSASQTSASILSRPLNVNVRFRMHRLILTFLVLLIAPRLDVLCTEAHPGIFIEVASDGTCQAAGLTAPCRDIGAKLHKAGLPLDTWISFRGDATLNSKVIKSTVDSLVRAGFNNMKIGFITEPVP